MSILINNSGAVEGAIELADYPFTMLSYFKAVETGIGRSEFFLLHKSGASDGTHHSHEINTNDNLRATWNPVTGTPTATLQIADINPINTDFTTWWGLMSTIQADGVTVEFNVWSGVGVSPAFFTGNTTVNTLDGTFGPMGRAFIGDLTITKFIHVQECCLIDQALTTGQLNSWAHGVPAPQANLPGNILFYQPLVTGYNEPTSVGTVTPLGAGIVESSVGPVMLTGSQETTTTGDINGLSQWHQVSVDTSGNVAFSDIGQLNSNLILSSGEGPRQISNIFHITTTGISGVSDVYNLTDLLDNHINITLNRYFTTVKSISVQNLSTGVGQYLDFDVSSSSGFSEMFADPSQPIVLNPKSCLHRIDTNTGYLVSDTNKIIEITPQSTGVVYEMVILGN